VNLRTVIVDDEPLARERIRNLLKRHRDVEIAAECADGAAAVSAITRLAPDLVFLDVQMPRMDGFEVLRAVLPRQATGRGAGDGSHAGSSPDGRNAPAIIFVTAYDQYALRAFDSNALDYLLKPFDRERFESALARARRQIETEKREHLSARLEALVRALEPGPRFLDRLVIRNAGRVTFLKAEEIDWIEAAGNYVSLHSGTESHLLRETMATLESKLDPAKFVRIHRSTIVNLDRVREIQPSFHGDAVVLLRGGKRLPLSRNYREKLHQHHA
jgi:two-component system LytT family response regulator